MTAMERRMTMKTYYLEAKYIKFVTIEDDADLDEELDKEFEVLPIEPQGKCDWSLSECNWEAM